MSEVSQFLMTDETGLAIAEQMRLQNEILSAIGSGVAYKPSSLKDVINIIRSGKTSTVF